MSIWQHVLNGLRFFNKYTLNHLTRKFAGKPRSPLAAIRHIGRHSGRLYETPIIAQPVVDGFVVPLAYGSNVDWYRNVLAAGNCRLLWCGQEYAIQNIQPMDAKTAYFGFPIFPQRLILRLLGSKEYVKMTGTMIEPLSEATEKTGVKAQ